MLSLTRPHYFLISLLAAFFNPFVLALYGASELFIVVVPLTLFVWFAVKWNSFISLTVKSSPPEAVLGISIILANFLRNAISGSVFGIFDMLIVLVGLIIAFFGLKPLVQYFLLPTAYLGVLVITYQLEHRIPEIQALQNFLAQVITGILNPIGIRATVWSSSADIITVWGRAGIPGPNPFALWIEKSCTGVKGMLAYGSLALLMVMDLRIAFRRKLVIILIGLAGTFLVNIARLLVIFLSAYQWGVDAGLKVHAYVGYSIFIVWVLAYWVLSFRYTIPTTGPIQTTNIQIPVTPS